MTATYSRAVRAGREGWRGGGGARSLGLVAPLSKQCVCQSVRADRCVGQSVTSTEEVPFGLYVTMRLKPSAFLKQTSFRILEGVRNV